MTIEVEQIDELILDPRAIAKQFIADAMVDLNAAREQAQIEYLADQERMRRLERSAATKRGWQNRKARLAGTTAPVNELEDVD
jgi:hypothetical protein